MLNVTLIVFLFCGFLLVLFLVFAIYSGVRSAGKRRERDLQNFRFVYDASIDKMLAQSPVDRDEIRRVRDSGGRGRARAIRLVRKWDHVPAEVAAAFVDLL